MKKLIAILLAAVCALAPPLARAQAFPTKPIHLIIPAAAGGPTDIIGRILGKIISERSGVPVVVDNKAGASGSIGVYATVTAAPDGYTLLLSTPDAVTVYPQFKRNAPYRTTDLTPITLVASTPYVFAVNAELPAKTMQEFVALAKRQRLTMATPGAGSSGHIVLELLKQRAGIDLLNVPYKGSAPALQSVLAGETSIAATSPVALKAQIDIGKLRALAVSKATRNPALPNVPTMVESGFPGFDVAAWFGVFAPPNTPAAVADMLNEMVLGAVRSPDYMSRMTALGLDVEPVSREKYGEMLLTEAARWKQLIESAKITSDE